MKISYNWLKSYVDIDLPEIELADLLTDIGLEVEGIQHYESIKGSLEGIVVGLVNEVVKHPEADKLSITKVNVGGKEDLQIVCGAPNVAVGQKVPVALVGATLYASNNESFKISKAKLRGVTSEGMICAEDEIGLGNSHAGILVLDEKLAIGKPLNEVYPVEKDIIFEIGLTPNRSDAFHHIGVARDVLATLNFRNKKGLLLHLPDTSTFKETNDAPVTVNVSSKEACPRYAGVVIRNLNVKPSPDWLQNRLKSIGQRPINNIVDITNFIMHEYGQPLHAFDLDLVGNEINVKTLSANAQFTTLDTIERKLSEEDLMICNASEGMCIAGVFGGSKSGVKPSTTAIFLESAYFDSKSIRRTSTRHNLRTDAAIHFEKGIDPNITVEALKRATLLIIQLAGGKVASKITDIQQQEFPSFKVELDYSRLNKLAGVEISKADVKEILALLEMKIIQENEFQLHLEVPPYRADVTREIDVIEDILRIFGFNNVPIPQKINASINISTELTNNQLYEKIANSLVAKGFYEIMVNSISKEKYYKGNRQVQLMNNLNAELTIMRESMIYTGLEPIKYNLNHSNNNCKFFELGKQYLSDIEGFKEEEKLSLWLTGNIEHSNWIQKEQTVDFYYLKSVVESLLQQCGLSNFNGIQFQNDNFEYSQTYGANKRQLVTFGLLHKNELIKLDIEQPVFYAEFDWNNILISARNASTHFKELPKYPSIRRDLALLIDKEVTFESIEKLGYQIGSENLKKIDLFDSYQDKKMDDNKKSYAISFIFRDNQKTLNDREVDTIMNKLMMAFKKDLGATIR